MRTLIEVCAGTVESCFTAWRVGAHRVELCSALALGGLTASFGAIEICKNETLIDIYVLIRPRQGDFLYEREEVKVMLRDIEMCGRLKVAGVVIGALDKHGKVDIEVCKQMIDTARSHGLGVTFHRAIDRSANIYESLEQVIGLGVDRVLTSGGAATALEGLDALAKMGEIANGRVIIMPGAGINEGNIAKVVKGAGVSEIHLSASEKRESASLFRHSALSFTPDSLGGDYSLKETSAEVLKKCMKAL